MGCRLDNLIPVGGKLIVLQPTTHVCPKSDDSCRSTVSAGRWIEISNFNDCSRCRRSVGGQTHRQQHARVLRNINPDTRSAGPPSPAFSLWQQAAGLFRSAAALPVASSDRRGRHRTAEPPSERQLGQSSGIIAVPRYGTAERAARSLPEEAGLLWTRRGRYLSC